VSADNDIPYLDQRTMLSVMKMGGKKRLDSLIDMVKGAGPVRIQDLKEARTLAEAKKAAQALKGSANNLGLAKLEDVCDQILESKTWTPGSALLGQAEQAWDRGKKALLDYRNGI
jgi:HPt (histidine-containing phosphotransfer) domain-containing protein